MNFQLFEKHNMIMQIIWKGKGDQFRWIGLVASGYKIVEKICPFTFSDVLILSVFIVLRLMCFNISTHLDTIRVCSTSGKNVCFLINLLLTFTVKVWCTHLYVEMVVYSDNDLSVNVKNFKLTVSLFCFHKYLNILLC